MRRTAVAIVLAVLLAGCAEFGGPREEADGILPAEARAKADAVAAAWKEDAVLVTLRGDAHDAQEPGIFTFGNPGSAVALDGRAGGWQFSYAVPGTVALMMAIVDADGSVSVRQLDLSSFAPDAGGYEEYFEMTPVDPDWLDMGALVATLAANETARPFTEGSVRSVLYSLKPDVRASYAWIVEVARDDAALVAVVDPGTWTFLAMKADLDGAPGASFEEESDAGKPPSGLTVRAAYGMREPGQGLSSLRFDLSYSKASRAFSLGEFAVKVDDGSGPRTYRVDGAPAYQVAGVGDEVPPGGRFSVTLPLGDRTLPPRSHVEVAFVTPKGAATRYETTTPITYGNAKVVTL